MKAEEFVKQIDRFADTWISNPAARFEFANIIGELLKRSGAIVSDGPIVGWVEEERRVAKAMGLGR